MIGAKADLHVHSKYSDRPSEWILRRIGAPECFVEPLEVYRRAKAAGMDFVTISDHNCIEGALEIAHFDDAFISNEVTTYFPEDGCKVHFLVTAIDEEQFRMIEELRPDIYELRDYVLREGILHSVAHPFFRVNRRLTPLHVEKLLLLFNTFEGLNGSRDRRASQLVNVIFRNLTPEWIDRAAERHGIEPHGPEPWNKRFTGGSDDHSGMYVGSAYTATPSAADLGEFLAHLRSGHHDLGGRAGTSLRLAHSFYVIGYQYYRERFGETSRGGPDLIGEIFERLVGTAERRQVGVGQKVRGAIGRATSRRRFNETEARLLQDLASLAREMEEKERDRSASQDALTFERASRLAHLVGFGFVERLLENLRDGRIFDALQNFASLAPVALGIAPYLASFSTQHKDETFLQDVAGHFPCSSWYRFKRGGTGWVTDTFSDVNGVAKMIQILGAEAAAAGENLEVLSCEAGGPLFSWRTNFQPIGAFSVPEYELQRMAFPPFLEVLEHIERQDYSELLISTPGPMGLLALLAARLLGLRTVGIYHTDFPAYVRHYTQNEGLVDVTWSFMRWFYEQMDLVLVPSEAYRQELLAAGFRPQQLEILRRGVDVDRFRSEKRSESFWRRFSPRGDCTRVIYVGRLSEEKNLALLCEEFTRLGEECGAELYLIGDGPDRGRLQERFRRDDRIRFTGFLDGQALAVAYASADLFVFPSETDTFGNVVLEAQASGLPTIVSTVGGPRELVVAGETGEVVDCSAPGPLAAAIRALLEDDERRRQMGRRAEISAQQHQWSQVLASLLESVRGPRRTEPDVSPKEMERLRRFAFSVDAAKRDELVTASR
ncbi:MAG: glycosyltransferase [Acidobacteria bacterium]|nr:MAG: glycosyltransferase [Acidobacteriota bacterium]REJ99529.1 MAG: glycosyltransferase [Acidobacteriota bacterium]